MEIQLQSEVQRLENEVETVKCDIKTWKEHVDSVHWEFAKSLREIKDLLQQANIGGASLRQTTTLSTGLDKRSAEPAEVKESDPSTCTGCTVEVHNDDNAAIDKSAVETTKPDGHAAGATASELRSEFDYSPLWDEDEVRANQESIWDAGLYIGLGMAWPESLFVALLFIVNLAMQLHFAQVISEMARTPNRLISEEGLQGLLLWRLSTGHHASTYDEFTGSNLVKRVCNQYLGLITADRYANAESSFSEYLRDRIENDNLPSTGLMEGLDLKLGEFLCLGALLIWVTIVCLELRDIFKTILAWMSIPRRRRTRLRRDPQDGSLSFRSISYGRCCCMWVCVIVPRTVVAIVLLLVGSDYLINTASVSDLILNAVALAFVFDIDELFYQFTPPVCHKLLIHSEPLPVVNVFRTKMSSGARRTLAGVIDMAFATLVVILWLYYYYSDLRDVVNRIEQASAIICGGQLDFVYTVDRATGLVHYSSDVLQKQSLSADELLTMDGLNNGKVLTLAMSAALQLSRLGSLGLPTVQRLAPEVTGDKDTSMSRLASRSDVSEMYREGLAEAMQRLSCQNMDGDPAERYALYSRIVLPWLQHAAPESPNMTSCAALASLCTSPASRVLVRRVCPVTCGCTHLFSGNFDVEGCPPSCQPLAERALRDMALAVQPVNSEGCVDAPMSSTNHTSSVQTDLNEEWWRVYFWQVQVFMASRGLLERVEGTTSWPFSAELQLSVLRRSARRYKLADGASVDLVAMAETFASALNASPCILEFFVKTVFDRELCESTLDDGSWFGTIAGLCPVQCKLCLIQADSTEKLPLGMMGRDWSWAKLLRLQLDYNMWLIEEIPPSNMMPLECGMTTVRVDTRLQFDHGFLPGPDAFFTINVTSSESFYTLDLCGEGTLIDTKMRIFRSPWQQAMDYYPELIIREDDDSCGHEGKAPSLTLTGLEPGEYLVWIDGPSADGGQIEVDYRCTSQPLFWEVKKNGNNLCKIASLPGDRSCIQTIGDWGGWFSGTMPGLISDPNCEFRVFPDAFRVTSTVLYPNGDFNVNFPHELLVPTAGGMISNTNRSFSAIGQMPTSNIHWRRSSGWLPPSLKVICHGFVCRWRTAVWEVCTAPFLQQPWHLAEVRSTGLLGCQRSYEFNKDCISNIGFGRASSYVYPSSEYCKFEVHADWRDLRGPNRGIKANDDFFVWAGRDILTLDAGTNTSRSFTGDGSGLNGAIAEENVVWDAAARPPHIAARGWTLCLDRDLEFSTTDD